MSIARSLNIRHVPIRLYLGSLIRADLDNTDLKILNMLARNGRFTFRSISVAIGLTTKSVKPHMLSHS
jgi:hypothetical protein